MLGARDDPVARDLVAMVGAITRRIYVLASSPGGGDEGVETGWAVAVGRRQCERGIMRVDVRAFSVLWWP
jgi:hypothetical protein